MTAGSLVQGGQGDSKGLGLKACHQKKPMCNAACNISKPRKSLQRPLPQGSWPEGRACSDQQATLQKHQAWQASSCLVSMPAIEGRASAVWLIGMPGKSPAPGGGPACSPAEVASLKDSWSSGQGIRLDIWRFGAGSSLLLLCWVTLSSLLGLSVLHLLLAFSPVWQGFLEGMLMEWFREAWMLQGLTLSHSCHARGGWGHLEPSCWKCLKNFPDTPA